MGIWDTLFKKHGGKKGKEIQELLGIIKQMEDNETKLLDQNSKLLTDNENLSRWLYRCQHPPKKSVKFDVVFS